MVKKLPLDLWLSFIFELLAGKAGAKDTYDENLIQIG